MVAPDALVISAPRLERHDDVWRLISTVDGTEFFIESTARLAPRPEVVVCPFVMPAMSRGWALEVEAPLGSRFLDNLEFVRARCAEWWPQLSNGEVHAPRAESVSPAAIQEATFYTGG